MSASWACLGEANELMYSLDDPITFQFAHAVYFEIETGLSKNTLHPIGIFDCAFFARVIIRLFSDHNSLRSVKAGHQVREYSWPNEQYYSNSYEANQLIMAKWLPDYRSSILRLALSAFTHETEHGTPPIHPLDLSILLRVIDEGMSSEMFFHGVLDGLDFSLW